MLPSPRPLVSLTLAFAAGILLAANAMPFVAGVAFFEFSFLLLFWVSRKPHWKTGAFALAFALLGSGRYALDLRTAPDDAARLAPRFVTLSGMVASDVSVQPARFRGGSPSARFVLSVRGASAQSVAQAMQGRAEADMSGPNGSAPDGASGQNAPPQANSGFVPASGSIETHVPLAPAAPAGRNRRGRAGRAPALQTQDGQETPRADGTNADAADADLPRPRYGDIVMVRGRLDLPAPVRNPGGFDYAAYLARRGIYATLTAHRYDDWRNLSEPVPPVDLAQAGLNSPAIPNSPAPPQSSVLDSNPLVRFAFAARHAVLRHGRRAHDRERAAVLNGILLGDRGDLPGRLNEDFERTGTSHILATAGLHVAVVVGLLLAGLRAFRIMRRPALLLSFLALIVYALMAGGRPSVVRAVIMSSVISFGILLEREPDLPNTLALAALLLLLYSPQNLFEPGFQLSFATVTSLVLLMPLAVHLVPQIGRRIPDTVAGAAWLRAVVETVAACFFLAVASFIGSAPLVAYYFNDVSLVSVIANTFVVPFIALVIALGFGAAFASLVFAPLALPLDRILDMLLDGIILVVRTCSAPSWSCVPVASPPVWFLFAYYAAFWGLAYHWQRTVQTRSTHNEDGRKLKEDGESKT